MPSVQFDRELVVGCSPSDAWYKITDAPTVAGWIDLIQMVEEVEPLSRYTAVLTDRLGPFRLSADLEIVVTDLLEPTRVTIVADGEDRQVASRIRVEATMTLAETSEGSSLGVSGIYEVTGRVATLGASMIRSKGEAVLDDFFSALRKELG